MEEAAWSVSKVGEIRTQAVSEPIFARLMVFLWDRPPPGHKPHLMTFYSHATRHNGRNIRRWGRLGTWGHLTFSMFGLSVSMKCQSKFHI